MSSSVFIEKSVVTKRLDDTEDPEVLFDATVKIAKEALSGKSNPDEVCITSQTFVEHFMPDFRVRFAEALGLDPSIVRDEKVYSNMQPILHRIFDDIQSTRKRVLIVGVEGLSFFEDSEDRSYIIGEALNAELRKRFGTMLLTIANLTSKWMQHVGLTREELRSLLEQVALHGYERAYENPHAQFYKGRIRRSEATSDYRNNPYLQLLATKGKKRITKRKYHAHDVNFLDKETRLFTKYDCCPGDTSQGAALVVGPEGPIQVTGWQNKADGRNSSQRSAFTDYPVYEAAHVAFEDLLKQTGISREDLVKRGIMEIHDAFGSLVPMTLMEMGYLKPENLTEKWEDMGDFPKERINTMGGLKAGHPLGATALVRMHEARQQLLGNAPCELQIEEPLDYALVQSVYGPRDQISMMLLKRC